MAKSTDSTNEPIQNPDEQLIELTNDLKRVQAEFVNYRRRAEAERAEVTEFAKARIVREFLTVRDSFDQEQAHRPADIDAKWAASIDSIRQQFDKVLKGLGVERFASKGQSFDPHLHEAIMMDDGQGAHEIVAEELQPGYKLGDTILRHAMVKVGHTDEAPAGQTDPVVQAAAAQPEPAPAAQSDSAASETPAESVAETPADQPASDQSADK